MSVELTNFDRVLDVVGLAVEVPALETVEICLMGGFPVLLYSCMFRSMGFGYQKCFSWSFGG